VVFEIPDQVEAAGYSKATKALLDSRKLEGLGWKARFDMETGLRHTVEILRSMQ
jgi:nucleoside-diphosphate-sugar epimerase